MTQPPGSRPFVADRTILEAEVRTIVDAADAAGLTIRVLGSIGVALHSHQSAAMLQDFERTYADLDVAAYRHDAAAIATLLTGFGYVADREVYLASEGRRSIFEHPERHIHLDVFYDRLEFCHVIPLDGRLEADRPTIPIAELLLSKLQIVKINQKDVVDIVLLLLDHQMGGGEDDTIDLARVGRLCADDWGLWRTLTQNLDKVQALASSYPQLDADQRARAGAAAEEVKARIDAEPKSMGWRMRDRIGDRRQWWTDVDEVT